MSFTNLYIQTEYSFLASNLAINKLVKQAKDLGYTSIGIADNNNTHGVVKFYIACREANIKPIIGVRLDLSSDFGYKNAILIYAKNNNGYHNLLKIVSLKNISNKDINIKDIIDYLEDLIVIIPSDENELVISNVESNFQNMQVILKNYLAIKKINNCSLYMGIDIQTQAAKYRADDLIYFAKQNGIPSVAICKTNFFTDSDYEIYKILRSIDLKTKYYEGSEKERNSYLVSPIFANDLFRKYPDLVRETENITNMCNVELDFGTYHMPLYKLNKLDCENCDYLHDLAFRGLNKRLVDNKINKDEYPKYIRRLDYELNVIKEMGFVDYFLIVFDYVKYAKNSGILVGPGRGSVVSSLAAYSLGITEIDPLQFDLLFERFLNIERHSMPDIDIDFSDLRRSEVFKYLGEKYGKNRVAHICTFNTFGPRSAIDDVTRVLDLKEMYANAIKSKLPKDVSSMNDAIEKDEEFRKMVEGNETIKNVVMLASKLENLPRGLSTHASGVLLSDDDLSNYTALLDGDDGISQTQLDEYDLEKIGLVKFDILSLGYLTTIDKILRKVGIKDKDINMINHISVYDKPVYNYYVNGNTDDFFQLGSEGMRRTLRLLKTSCFDDVVSAIALYRPGPMDEIPTFAKRKLGQEKISYLHPDLEPILKSTYGIIVYQEQILLIANKFAGMTLGEADVLRSAVSKKKLEKLQEQEHKFVSGAVKKGYDEKIVREIFSRILKFASYGFNKCHSVGYAYIGYQMAFLKYHYLKEYNSVLMSSAITQPKRMKKYIMELKKAKVTVEVPSVNYSDNGFNVVDNKVYYSLSAIKNIGEGLALKIIEERKNGLYESYDSFIARTKEFLNRSNVEALIYAGALDEFKITRKSMILEYDKSIELASFGSMFAGELKTREFFDDEFSYETISNYERLALGMNLKYDMFLQYSYIKKKYNCVDLENLSVGKTCHIMFILDGYREIKTKKGDNMAFLTMSDDTTSIEGTMFSDKYLEYKDYLVVGKMFIAEVKIQNYHDNLSAIINKLYFNKNNRD